MIARFGRSDLGVGSDLRASWYLGKKVSNPVRRVSVYALPVLLVSRRQLASVASSLCLPSIQPEQATFGAQSLPDKAWA